MKTQRHITVKLRAYLVDWLAELHYKFKMMPETLFVTIGILDRYLAIETDTTKEML
jgi:cyclin B